MNALLFLGGLGTGEIILIVLVVLLLFGARRIPELMRGLGKGVRNFKDGMNGVDEKADAEGGRHEEKEDSDTRC